MIEPTKAWQYSIEIELKCIVLYMIIVCCDCNM